MATAYTCDRCGAPMGRAPDANLSASLGEGVKCKLTGKEREVEAELCKDCFLALKDWLAGTPVKATADVSRAGPIGGHTLDG